MDPKYLFSLVTAALGVAASNAEQWQTILDVEGTSSYAISVDPQPVLPGEWPRLIVTGQTSEANSAGTPYKIFRLTQSDTPAPLTPIYEPLNASGALVYSLASQQPSSISFAGTLNAVNNGNKWLVRGSHDAGASWFELPRWDLSPGVFARARGVTMDPSGQLFACGMAGDAANYSHWIVMKSDNGGASWSPLDDFKASSTLRLAPVSHGTEALGIAYVPQGPGALFAVGASNDTWIVKRSVNGGARWDIVDQWLPKGSRMSRAMKISTDGLGRIFVMGGLGSTDSPNWVVRMSQDAGANWQTVFGPWYSGSVQRPNDFTVDAFGNLWIGGVIYTSSGSKKPTVWTSTPTTIRLQPSPTGAFTATRYSLPCATIGGLPYHDAGVNAITADNLGNVYVNGSYSLDAGSTWRWFVQRFVP